MGIVRALSWISGIAYVEEEMRGRSTRLSQAGMPSVVHLIELKVGDYHKLQPSTNCGNLREETQWGAASHSGLWLT
jgi:hypothetical protein